MKKYIISIFAVLFGIFMTSSAMASTNITLVPSTVNVVAGQKVDLTVYTNSNGVKNGTVKVEVKYPADLLQVSSFVQSSTWMSNTETGYDTIDNTNGVLIKTAGYPRGFTSTVSFGTITFTAKKAGVATVEVSNGSLALDASGKNAFSGDSKSIINITTKPVPALTNTNNSTTTNNSGLTGQEATAVGALDGLFGTSSDNKLTASVFGSMMSERVGWLLGVIVLLGIILWFLFWIKRRNDEKDNKEGNINK